MFFDMKRSRDSDDGSNKDNKKPKVQGYTIILWGTCIKCGQRADSRKDCPKCEGTVVRDKETKVCNKCGMVKEMHEDEYTCSDCEKESNNTDELDE